MIVVGTGAASPVSVGDPRLADALDDELARLE